MKGWGTSCLTEGMSCPGEVTVHPVQVLSEGGGRVYPVQGGTSYPGPLWKGRYILSRPCLGEGGYILSRLCLGEGRVP